MGMAKWAKGVSGNPGGRSKGEGDIRALAQKHTPAAINRLVKIVNDDKVSPSAQVAASVALLDRGWGRPAQTINANFLSGNDRMPSLLDELSPAIFERIKNRTEITHEAEPLPEPLVLPALIPPSTSQH